MNEMTTAELASGVEYADASLYAETCPCGAVVPVSDHAHDSHWEAERCAEGSPVGFLLIQLAEDRRRAGFPDAILSYGPDAVEMDDVPSWLRAV